MNDSIELPKSFTQGHNLPMCDNSVPTGIYESYISYIEIVTKGQEEQLLNVYFTIQGKKYNDSVVRGSLTMKSPNSRFQERGLSAFRYLLDAIGFSKLKDCCRLDRKTLEDYLLDKKLKIRVERNKGYSNAKNFYPLDGALKKNEVLENESLSPQDNVPDYTDFPLSSWQATAGLQPSLQSLIP